MIIGRGGIQELIIDTLAEFRDLLRRPRRDRYKSMSGELVASQLGSLERILEKTGFKEELFNDLSTEGYSYLLEKCTELASLYNLPIKTRLERTSIEEEHNQYKIIAVWKDSRGDNRGMVPK